MVELVADGSSSSPPPSSPSPPRPPIVTPLIADPSPPRERRTPRHPPSPPPEIDNPPSPPPPSNVAPPSPLARMIDINQLPPSSPPTVSSPNLGNEVHPVSRLHELVEGLTTSDSSEDEHFIPPCSPSTVLSPPKIYLLTWYNHPCTRMPTVLTDPIPHTGEDESVGLEDIDLNEMDEDISTPHSEHDHEANVEPDEETVVEADVEPDLEAEVRNLTSIPTRKRKGLRRIFATRSKVVHSQPLKKRPR
ncbi:leucine-rich repeat extensin-like protein 5 [Cynara cardunculus var. scolymus]|uniref:leucine-rich repeat extensin-like protein 5 n=1 Tax=Cynara cardunculus var. scolymus TaxID=59895 RepID=UPI000D629C8B|nr:leucine-rich repeat extensin-like protein 5 [Cynara cardunculus var. scolymus]